MTHELRLRFPNDSQVLVSFDNVESGVLAFASPITDKDRRDLRWYLEMYGARSLGDPDDAEAARIAARLPELGGALFGAVFRHRAAQRLFNRFQDQEDGPRLLTVSSHSPAVLALPWELLYDPSQRVFLYGENPPISIRRRVPGATGGRAPFRSEAKDRIHLLFVVSRPEGTGFLDPRADPRAVMDALEEHAPGRVTWEFLRPPTLNALVERLKNRRRPAVDILHFDGHGLFDEEGGLPQRFGTARRGSAIQASELLRQAASGPHAPADTGYLLFETADGEVDFVSAEELGRNLHRHRVSLVVLSACQSAALGTAEEEGAEDEEPSGRAMNGVASRLTASGIPAVLAMSNTVLADTTRLLFGELYEWLARGYGIGEALDNARQFLANNPDRYEVQRGADRVWLGLQDWFVPALYQAGPDVPVLRETAPPTAGATAGPRLSPSLALRKEGFFGRRRELWTIERWFAGEARIVTVSGFGGQGKTALAQEAGRWLTRTGMFQAAAFVSYAGFQGIEAVPVAVNEIGSVLGESLPDQEEARLALARTPTLVILDNLEELASGPLGELLDAAGVWTRTGGCRVLLTTRQPGFGPAGRLEGALGHERIVLDGLGSRRSPDDALEWFARLWRLPPAPTVRKPSRQELEDLFAGVRFHPLSIRVLTQQLKTRPAWEVERRLRELLAEERSKIEAEGEYGLPGLVASIQLSLDRLDPEARALLPRLGVFQGGAMENNLLAVTKLGETGEQEGQVVLLEEALGDEDNFRYFMEVIGAPKEEEAEVRRQVQEELEGLRRHIAYRVPPDPVANVWPSLRRQLEAAALVELETLPGGDKPFLRFHPTLAPLLWKQSGPEERARLRMAHRERYLRLADQLFEADRFIPHQARAVALREMPNLLYAIHGAIADGDPGVLNFATNLGYFFTLFGWHRKQAEMNRRLQDLGGEPGSPSWVSAQGDRISLLQSEGRADEAAAICLGILEHAKGEELREARICFLLELARCHGLVGRLGLAEQRAREGLAELESIRQPDPWMRKIHSGLLGLLGEIQSLGGRHDEAHRLLQEALRIIQQSHDAREEAAVTLQLGMVALHSGDLEEAERHFREALTLFQELHEPLSETLALHHLGVARERAEDWAEAELLYRQAAQIREREGLLTGSRGAVVSWVQLAGIAKRTGNLLGAEQWYRKAAAAARAVGDALNVSLALHGLASLLRQDPGRLAEARQLAEEELAVAQTLDPGVGEAWKSYDLLADIVGQEGKSGEEAEYRRLARQAMRASSRIRQELRRHGWLIAAVCAAVADPRGLTVLDETLAEREERGWVALVAAIRGVLAGERDEKTLCERLELDLEDSLILGAIFEALEDPSTMEDLLVDPE